MSHQKTDSNEYKLKIYDHRTKAELRDKTNRLINDLMLFGHHVSITSNDNKSNKSVSRRFHKAVKDDIVSFAWNPWTKKSIVVIKPEYRIIRDGESHIRIRKKGGDQ